MISMRDFYGGGVDAGNVSVNLPIKVTQGRCLTVNPTVPISLTHDAALGAPYYMVGGPYFFLWNRGATHAITLKESDGTTYATVGPGQIAEIHLYKKDLTKARWLARVKNVAA